MKILLINLLIALAFATGNPIFSDDGLANSKPLNDDLFQTVDDGDMYYDYPQDDSPSEFEGSLVRHKRQARDNAIGLALNHNYPVGRIHGRFDLNAAGNDARNFHAHGGLGAGSVLWRSNNNRHSLGVGGYVEQQRGRFQGFGYRSKPNYGVGVGYRFKF